MRKSDRFWSLLDQYIETPDSELPPVRQTIQEEFACEKAALVMDMSGFSRITQRQGILFYLSLIRRMQLVTRPLVERHGGTVVKYEADNLFAVFDRVDDAIDMALASQDGFDGMNIMTRDDRDIHISVGIAWGEILLIPQHDFFGDAVNLASKLGEDIAQRGEVLIADSALERLEEPERYPYERIGFDISGVHIEAGKISR